MFLDNYYQLRTQAGLTYTGGGFVTNLNLQVNLPDGAPYTLAYQDCNGRDGLISPSNSSYVKTSIPSASGANGGNKFIVFGDGNAPVETDNYSISGSPIQNIRISSVEGIRTVTGSKIMYTFKYEGTNTATIKEVCIFDNFTSSLSNTSRKVALWREVFQTPLQVPAGSIFTYNFEIAFN